MSTRFQLRLPQAVHAAMIEQALAESPNECCGLLAGRPLGESALVTHRYPLVNDAANPPTEYHSESRSILAAFRSMRELGVELLAVYHSHPTSQAVPSAKDRADNAYEDSVMHLIISLADGQPELRGWWLGKWENWEGQWVFDEPIAKTT